MTHPEIPPALWTSFCPFRTLSMVPVRAWLRAFGRWSHYGVLPNDEERTHATFDVLRVALTLPLADHGQR